VPSLRATYGLAVPSIGSAGALYGFVVTQQAITGFNLQPPRISSSAIIFAPTINRGIRVPLFTNGTQLFAPGLTLKNVGLTLTQSVKTLRLVKILKPWN
jgi:hypothetical protein